jgi:hypothetical protein
VAIDVAIKVRVKKRQNRSEFSEEDAGFYVRDKPASIGIGEVMEVVHPFMGFSVFSGTFFHPFEPRTGS